MKNSLYPNTLFHFTNKNSLFNILSHNFKISYARETLIGKEHMRKIGVPMVSFCDIRLSEIKDHIDKYGNYGIGLSKNWANSNGLNPVIYMNKDCYVTDNYIKGLNGIYQQIEKVENPSSLRKLPKSYLNILDMYRYMKNYEAPLFRKGELVNSKYRYADEREWRYVPNLESGIAPFVAKSKIDNDSDKMLYNEKAIHLSLHFEPNDISYLIISNESEIKPLIAHLRNVKNRFSSHIIDKLASRILTVEQIRNDI